MELLPVRRVWIPSLAFAFTLQSGLLAEAQNPQLQLNVDYSWTQSISTGEPEPNTGETSFYSLPVPFRVSASVPFFGGPFPYRFYTDDLSVDFSGTALPPGYFYVSAPSKMLSEVALNGEIYNQYGTIVAYDRKTELISELPTSVEDWLADCPIPRSTIRSWARQGGGSAVNAVFDMVFTTEAMANYGAQQGLTEQQVQDLTNNLRSQFRQQLDPYWDAWVDSAFGIQRRYVVRIGSSNPFVPDAAWSINSLPQAVNSGVSGLLAPGQSYWDILGQVVDLHPNTDAITNLALDEFYSFTQTGQLSNLVANYPDTPWLTRAGLRFPLGYTTPTGFTVEGSLGIGVENVTFNDIGGTYVRGDLDAHTNTPSRYFFINASAEDSTTLRYCQILCSEFGGSGGVLQGSVAENAALE